MKRYELSRIEKPNESGAVIYKKAVSVNKVEADKTLPNTPIKKTLTTNAEQNVKRHSTENPSFTLSNRETFGEPLPDLKVNRETGNFNFET